MNYLMKIVLISGRKVNMGLFDKIKNALFEEEYVEEEEKPKKNRNQLKREQRKKLLKKIVVVLKKKVLRILSQLT